MNEIEARRRKAKVSIANEPNEITKEKLKMNSTKSCRLHKITHQAPSSPPSTPRRASHTRKCQSPRHETYQAPHAPESTNHHTTKHLKSPPAAIFATIKNQGCNLDKIKGTTSVEIKEFQEKSNKNSTKTNPKQSSIK